MILDHPVPTHPEVRRVYHEIETELGFGMVPNIFKSMAECPSALAAHWAMFKHTILEGELPRIVKEMVGVVVSSVNKSEYAKNVHLHSLGVQGVSEAVLSVLAAGEVTADGLPYATQAMLAFAKRAATDRFALTPADFEALDDAGFSASEKLEIIGAVDLFQAVNSYTDLMRVPVDSL
ncbi:MAG: carboxymuconolactone decarboxylase family protein [Chloroflexota bacterium]